MSTNHNLSLPLLEVENLTKSYQVGKSDTVKACQNVTFSLDVGEVLGIVGESGCGKTTLLRLISKLEAPSGGSLRFKGVDILDLKGKDLQKHFQHVQMIFQDPELAFYQKMRVGQILEEPLHNFGKLSIKDTRQRVSELLDLVHLPQEFAERFPRSLSGGQRQRLGIARALATNPDVLICDEATSALDVSVQDKIMKLLAQLQKDQGLSILFVCHDLALVKAISHRVMVMYLGRVVEVLPSDTMEECAKHPYTQGLLKSVFTFEMDRDYKIEPLEGEVPSGINLPLCCPFYTRCEYGMPRCAQEVPSLVSVSTLHQVACFLYQQ